jgi:hypothetical protein
LEGQAAAERTDRTRACQSAQRRRGGANRAAAARSAGVAKRGRRGCFEEMVMRFTLLLCSALLLSACAETRPGEVVLPEDADGGAVALSYSGPNDAALIVPVHINGAGPFDFVLDTGATLTCVSRRLAEQLGLDAEPGAVGFGAGIGGAGQVELVRFDSVRIGATQARDMMGCTLDLTHFRALGTEIDGLVGLNFLREFRVTLDFGQDVLLLEPH